ncbi:MAG TPA: YCF48-related protein, partial [Bacteroidales bacterium]|nr:YCF48-related protein [Bacteroidales bacterium]
MKKIVVIFILFVLPYIAFSQCVAQLPNDTVIKCGTQTSLHIQLPWRTINSNVTTHLNDLFFTNDTDGYVVGNNGVILKTIDKGETFSTLTSGTTETLNSVYFKNSLSGFCAGNNGILLSTTNGGTSWSNVSITNLTSHIKSIFFINESIGYFVGTSGCLYKTINGGNSWYNVAPVGSSSDSYNGVFFSNLNNGIVVGNSGKILKTADGGLTWTPLTLSSTIDLSDVFLVSPNKGFIIGSNQIFQSLDGGYSWMSYVSYPTIYQDLCFQNSNVGFAVGYYGTIMKTIDGGTSWQKELTCTTNEFMAVCARDSFFMAVGKNGSIAKYEIPQQIVWSPNINIDKSDPFNPIVYPFSNTNYYLNVLFDNTPDIYDSVSITLDPFLYSTVNDQNLFCGNSIQLSSETEWFPIYNKRIFSYTDQYFISPDTGFVITDDGYILKTTNGAYTWDSIAYFGVSLYSLEFLNPQVAFALGSSSLFKTINGGLSWTQLPISTPATLKSVDFINSNVGFVCGGIVDINGSSATILKTTDGGLNWELKHLTSGYELREIYFVNDTIGFAIGSNGTILRTNNGGELWTSIPNSNIAYLNSVHFTNLNDGYIVGSGVALKTVNGGLNWSICQGPFNNSYLCSVVFTDSLTGYILSIGTNSVVVFKTTDAGLNWTTHPVDGVSYIPTTLSFPTKTTGYLVGTFGAMAKLEIPVETWYPSNFIFQNSDNQYFAYPNQTTTLNVSAVN